MIEAGTVRAMTQAFAVDTTINRPAAEVWATLVDWSQDAECSTTGLWSIVGPLLRLAMKRTDSPQLEALKELLEPGSG